MSGDHRTSRSADIAHALGVRPSAVLDDPVTPVPLSSHLAVGDLAWAGVGAASLVAATIAGAPAAVLDPRRIALAYASERYGSVDGEAPTAFAPLSGFFRASDGWVRTHGNYPHHAAALRNALDLGDDADADDVRAALLTTPAEHAARRIVERGGIASAVHRERADVEAARREEPLVKVSRLGASAARPLAPTRRAPLAGVRVLDLTRVIAGPICTRTLALLGADVLRVDPAQLPEIPWQHLDTGHGKTTAQLDLGHSADRDRFESLAHRADVIVLGYRPAGLARLGLSPRALADRHPGIIVAQLSAWGAPDRRGFDSIVQAASGISWVESRHPDSPGALPAQALDHTAGYLLATAIMALLLRRAAEGGSWLAETSLRRVAAELLGMPRTDDPAPFEPVDPLSHLQLFDVDGTQVRTVGPAVAYEGGPTRFAAPHAWGTDPARWRDD